MREVTKRTGVNPITLRAWERRYGLVRPIRSEGGHRLYTLQDISTIQKIVAWTERGVAVGKVGELLALEKKREIEQAKQMQHPQATQLRSARQEWVAVMHQAVQEFDDIKLDSYYGQLLSIYEIEPVYHYVLMPLWHKLFYKTPLKEHSYWLFYDDFLRTRLKQRLQYISRKSIPCILFTMIEEQGAELDLLLSALLVNEHYGHVRVLPAQQRLEELAQVCQAIQPRSLVIYSSVPLSASVLTKLNRIALTINCPVAIAGAGVAITKEVLPGSCLPFLGKEPQLIWSRLEQYLSGALDV